LIAVSFDTYPTGPARFSIRHAFGTHRGRLLTQKDRLKQGQLGRQAMRPGSSNG
jgi:hypothetical protein